MSLTDPLGLLKRADLHRAELAQDDPVLKLMGAVHQIGQGGTEEQVRATTEALDAARRTIYKLLAD